MKEYIKPKPDMTQEELQNTWYINFLSKVLKKKYPFIKGLVARPEGVSGNKSLVFLDGIVNPWEMAEYYKDEGLVTAHFTRPDRIIPNHTSPLSSMFDMVDEHGDKYSSFDFVYKGIEKDIEDTLEDIHRNDSIPNDLKFYKRPLIMNYYQTTD